MNNFNPGEKKNIFLSARLSNYTDPKLVEFLIKVIENFIASKFPEVLESGEKISFDPILSLSSGFYKPDQTYGSHNCMFKVFIIINKCKYPFWDYVDAVRNECDCCYPSSTLNPKLH